MTRTSSWRATIAPLGLGVLLGFIVGLAFEPPGLGTSSVTGSPSPGATGVAAATTKAGASPTKAPMLTPRPTLGPCEPPLSLPAAESPVAAPVVKAGSVAMLFTSWLYGRDSSGALFARDTAERNWAVGLWFVAPGSSTPRLLVSPGDGMVLPLGLSPKGDMAAVWWVADRRAIDEPPCVGGIYLVATDGSSSRLVRARDYSFTPTDSDEGTVAWSDPHVEGNGPRSYQLPTVSFSPDGRNMALISNDRIEVMFTAPELNEVVREHVGRCPDWNWSLAHAFVAGCDDMTNAWIVDEEFSLSNVALPQPDLEIARPGWEAPPGQAIGFDADGNLVVARFYGFPTGCETPGCELPPPAWTISTIEQGSGAVTSRGAEVGFIVSYSTDVPTWISPDGSWVYADIDTGKARTIRTAAGLISRTRSIGSVVGQSQDGRLLFGRSELEGDPPVVIRSINAVGTVREVATIDWPGTVTSDVSDLLAFQVLVAAP